jgi:hypothetical protein
MKLFANGCSFTYGFDLKNLSGTGIPDQAFREKMAWPGQLSQLINASELYNIGENGSSNHKIARTTIDFFLDKINQRQDLTDFVAVVQWSHLVRSEFYKESIRQWIGMQPNHKNQVESIAYYKQLYSSTSMAIDFIMNVVMLASFFSHHKIQYVFLSVDDAFNQLADILPADEKFKLKYLVDNCNWINGHPAKADIQSMNIEQLSTEDYHPSVNGHKKLAEIIQGYLAQ